MGPPGGCPSSLEEAVVIVLVLAVTVAVVCSCCFVAI